MGAITYDEYGVCKIDESKCIQCGHCIHSCPFGAIGSKAFVVDVVNAIRSGKEVIAMCAPATEGQFGEDISMASIRKPPEPAQVSNTTSFTDRRAKRTISSLIWSGVKIIFLLSTFPARDRKILYARPKISCFSSF